MKNRVGPFLSVMLVKKQQWLNIHWSIYKHTGLGLREDPLDLIRMICVEPFSVTLTEKEKNEMVKSEKGNERQKSISNYKNELHN